MTAYGHRFDHVVVAAGSGGTLAGLAVGCFLARLDFAVHGVNIQHSPEAYYDLVAKEAEALGCTSKEVTAVLSSLGVHNGAGHGYAVPAAEDLAFIAEIAAASGVVLDHVYSGKALYHFCEPSLQKHRVIEIEDHVCTSFKLCLRLLA